MLKRAFDFVFSLLGLILLIPFFLFISILIIIFDGKPVFFVQYRVGLNGKLFRVFKFKTMRHSLECDKQLATSNDVRITKLGTKLRLLKIDELPQLFNVLLGHMSLVGYRPEIPFYVDRYTKEQKEILKYKPGIVDPATLVYSRKENDILSTSTNLEKDYIEKILPEKISISLNYAKSATFFTDLKCLLNCFKHLFFK